MRITLSLPDLVGEQLRETANRLADGNASLVADIALRYVLGLPTEELDDLIARYRLDRKASTRHGWTEAFWTTLGKAMGVNDTIDNPYTARNYGDFYAVLLLKDVGRYDEDPDPFCIHVAPQMWTPENSHKQNRFWFDRSRSPVSAAEEVAAWLRSTKNGV